MFVVNRYLVGWLDAVVYLLREAAGCCSMPGSGVVETLGERGGALCALVFDLFGVHVQGAHLSSHVDLGSVSSRH